MTMKPEIFTKKNYLKIFVNDDETSETFTQENYFKIFRKGH